MGISFIPQRSVLTPTVLGAIVANGSGETLLVGAEYIVNVNWAGSSNINSNVTEVADIDNPSDWTNLVSINDKKCIVGLDSAETTGIQVASDETSGNALRMQILRDGDIIFDAKVVANGSDNFSLSINPPRIGANGVTYYMPIYCENSFVIRVARKGTFSSSSSYVRMGNVRYNEVKLI